MRKRVRQLFFIGIILLIFGWLALENFPVKVSIQARDPERNFAIWMPRKDKNSLDYFFRETCFLNIWAYTLMGSKPMSIDQYVKPWTAFCHLVDHPDFWDVLQLCFWPPHYERIKHLFTPHELKMKLGWEALQKHMKHFPNSRFVLHTFDHENGYVSLALIDKEKFTGIVKKCYADFEDALLLQKIEPEDLMGNDILVQFLSHLHGEAIHGTLLGYGRDNAWAFSQYRDTNFEQSPLISAWADEEQANLEQLNAKTLSFQPWDYSDIFYPRFACNPNSEETKQLKQIYREEREKIIHYFEGKDLVGATLSLYASGPP